jgi:hypothetical protein
MTAKHTPGPLGITETSPDQFRIEGDWEKTSQDMPFDDAYVNFGGFFGSYGPHMFAAAPDLLDALKDTLRALQNAVAILSAHGLQSTMADPTDKARAAIAKAEGAQ